MKPCAVLTAIIVNWNYGVGNSQLLKPRTSYPLIFSYEPKTPIVDHAAIDLDQRELEFSLLRGNLEGLLAARRIYTEGGHSRSYASLSLSDPLNEDIDYDTPIIGYNEDGEEITGTSLKYAIEGNDIIWFLYDVSNTFDGHVECQVGGSEVPTMYGCLASNGTIDIGWGNLTMNYTYDPMIDNRNARRFDKFSMESREKMYECDSCPYRDYLKFYNYYGQFDYADVWIRSAFDGVETNYMNGNVDFSRASYNSRAEAIQAATTSLSLWMYVIREMEYALDHCDQNCAQRHCDDDKVHHWDQAVAFYTGALEQGNGGYLLYALADRMCIHFGTCGYDGTEEGGNSFVNFQIFKQFSAGQLNLLEGKCSEARKNKERIVQYMTVPLVQATLRQAHEMQLARDESDLGVADTKNSYEKEVGLYATNAAAVLPLVHACSPVDADSIYMHMHMHHTDFIGLKRAFERNYDCMGITCEQVGGLIDKVVGGYHQGAQPCSGGSSTSGGGSHRNGSGKTAGIVIGVIMSAVAIAGVAVLGYQKFRSDIEFVGNTANIDDTNYVIKEAALPKRVIATGEAMTTQAPAQNFTCYDESQEPGMTAIPLT